MVVDSFFSRFVVRSLLKEEVIYLDEIRSPLSGLICRFGERCRVLNQILSLRLIKNKVRLFVGLRDEVQDG